MGIRFRKRISLGKLFKINISKSGISTTIGIEGASINIGKNGMYANIGIPKTGIYAREKIGNNNTHKQNQLEFEGYSSTSANKESEHIEILSNTININTPVDELFKEVAYFVISENKPSSSAIKNKFNLSYTRAGELIDQLEHSGIISKFSGSSARKVLVSIEAFNEFYSKPNA